MDCSEYFIEAACLMENFMGKSKLSGTEHAVH